MRSLELFSGAGGLALGLEKAGFEHVALVEKNGDACDTLRLNRPRWNILETDVRLMDFAAFGPVELVAGGPPCQPFSIGGKSQGYDDLRDMFPQAVRAVHALRPQAFMFENVRGLLRPAFRNYVEYIRLWLTYPDFPVSMNISWDANLLRLQRHHTAQRFSDSLTYQVSIHLADAADYGVPQRRHRVFFIGFRSDLDAKWFFPAPTHSAEELRREKQLGNYWREHNLTPPLSHHARARDANTDPLALPPAPARWRTVRDAIADLGEPRKTATTHPANHVLQPGAKAYPGHTGSLLDAPAKALKAGDHGVPGGENMLDYGDGRVRYFSVRESARLQTFPDDYLFPGSWTESMRQIGNAVPVQLAATVATSINRHLRALNEQRTRRHSFQPA